MLIRKRQAELAPSKPPSSREVARRNAAVPDRGEIDIVSRPDGGIGDRGVTARTAGSAQPDLASGLLQQFARLLGEQAARDLFGSATSSHHRRGFAPLDLVGPLLAVALLLAAMLWWSARLHGGS